VSVSAREEHVEAATETTKVRSAVMTGAMRRTVTSVLDTKT